MIKHDRALSPALAGNIHYVDTLSGSVIAWTAVTHIAQLRKGDFMSAQVIDLSTLSAVQIAGLIELGIVAMPDAPVNGNAFTPSEARIEAYKGWMSPREAYTLTHPIVKKGPCQSKATLNYLPIAGVVSTASLPKGWRGGLHRSGVEKVATTENAKGHALTTTYGQRANADGRTMDARAPEFFKAGGQLIVDEQANTASLRVPSGFEFAPEVIIALKELA